MMDKYRKHISAKAARELLEDKEWLLDEELWNSTRYDTQSLTAIYKHTDGRILVVWGRGMKGKADLFTSPSMYLSFMDYIKRLSESKPEHILKDILLYEREFTAHIPKLVLTLAMTTKTDTELLDFSDDSLDLLTKKIRRLGGEKCLQPELFSSLVAYLSQAMRYRLQGTIRMRQSRTDPEVWEPWVFDNEDRSCQCWSQLYRMFAENEYGYDLKFIDMEIKLRRV